MMMDKWNKKAREEKAKRYALRIKAGMPSIPSHSGEGDALYEVIRLRERFAELEAENHKLKDEIEAHNCGIGRKLYISAGNVPDDDPKFGEE